MQVAATLTPSTAPVVAGAMIWAYEQVTGHAPVSRASWEIPLAQSADETMHWAVLTHWNLGFISQPNKNQPYFYRGSNPVPFAVYNTLGDGAVALMKWLNKYGLLAAADNGDYAGYAAGLKAGGYLGSAGDYTGYVNTIAGIVPSYASLVPVPYGGSGPSIVQRLSNGKALALGAGLLTLAALAAYTIHPKPRRVSSRKQAFSW